MKNFYDKMKSTQGKIAYTFLVAAVLLLVFFLVVSYVYIDAENDGFESLHMRTKEIKDDITLQIISDRENLSTMANFASKLYSDGEGFGTLLNSFKSIGLIENIGILMPDNNFVTRVGTIDVSEYFDFAKEVEKGQYISGRLPDITTPDREVIRSAVPINANGETVAILYGVIELSTLKERYLDEVTALEAQLYVLERGTGKFIINTRSEHEFGNISSMSDRKFLKEFSYDKMKTDILSGNNGFSSFISNFTGETLYAHYSPLEIADWTIMLCEPSRLVFEEARTSGRNLLAVFVLIILIMSLYILTIFAGDRKQSKKNAYASNIRKKLLVINQDMTNVSDSLKEITDYSKARSAFFVDTNGESYNYVVPSAKGALLSEEDRQFFVLKLFKYIAQNRKSVDVAVSSLKIRANNHLAGEDKEFCDFLIAHEISKVALAVVVDKNNHITLLGAVNPKSRVTEMLKDVAVCYSMAIYNKRHLDKTEFIAVTDSLTGLSNRMAYKRDVEEFDKKHPEMFACVYIDVNELHFFNNKYGHAAGDGMLLFVANTLKEVFYGSRIYRMGGDEFLVFTQGLSEESVKKSVELLNENVTKKGYHISIGVDYRMQNLDTAELVSEAEKRMYQDKAEYYQQKEKKNANEIDIKTVDRIKTGIREVDAILSIVSRRYYGIYCVSLEKNTARRVLMPEYLKEYENWSNEYNVAYTKYIQDLVHPDYQRAMLKFLEYDVLKKQLADGMIPTITYTKTAGGKFRLSVYPLTENSQDNNDTIWVFEKEL